jgi:hypothetical protein
MNECPSPRVVRLKLCTNYGQVVQGHEGLLMSMDLWEYANDESELAHPANPTDDDE